MSKKQFGVENDDDWPILDAAIWSSILILFTFLFAALGA